MSNSGTPIDDTVQLIEVMPYDFSDDLEPIVQDERRGTSLSRPTEPPDNENSNGFTGVSKKRAYLTLGILLFVNLLNYMDRYTVSGVLIKIKEYYHDLENSEAGLIQTAFICSYMVFSPVFGYLGDRYTRKYLMAGGILLWALFTLASSFVPADYYYGFVLLRAMVGIGEASYSTIAPTIIADLFAKDLRTQALMIFYFAIPVGSGLGYIVGSNVADLLGSWQWALRVTPGLGVLCVVLIIFVSVEPQRGMSEGHKVHLSNTSVKTDLKELATNKSFVLSTVGFTCVAFVTGALAFLAPTFMTYSTQFQGNPQSEAFISLIFGIITVAAGFLGVALGAQISQRWKRTNPRADPLTCALGLISCVPFLFFGLVLSRYNTLVTWILIFLGETMLCLNWAVTADILLYVVIPTRRSLAESGQILVSHAFGDAISPYIIGTISDALASKEVDPHRPAVQFPAMQTALYLTTFICVFGGAFYLATALFVEKDKKRAELATQGLDPNLADDSDDDAMLVPGGRTNCYLADEEVLNAAEASKERCEVPSPMPAVTNGSGDGFNVMRSVVV
ncbi:hypothetical protein EGW08_019221 [Elysia chlorotica]|uniref:Major facilitator superfamily (MFS) profile domain-containing protein n=1 Tax=Elysia chlorotica TaxID=188477 RepID=A0A3S1AV37_ELYCH|nr:hypothetical protein EGW08_019221 [Elysia chlorotica]